MNGKKWNVVLIVLLILIQTIVLNQFFYVSVVIGQSMEPEIEHHDIIILYNTNDVEVGDTAHVEFDSKPYPLVHEVKEVNNTKVVTKGINNNYADPPVPRDNVKYKVITVVSPPEQIKNVYGLLFADSYSELSQAHRQNPVCVIDSPITGKSLSSGILHDYCYDKSETHDYPKTSYNSTSR